MTFMCAGLARTAVGSFSTTRGPTWSPPAAKGARSNARAGSNWPISHPRTPGAMASVAQAARQIADTAPRESKLAAWRHISPDWPTVRPTTESGPSISSWRRRRFTRRSAARAARPGPRHTGNGPGGAGQLDAAVHHYALSLAAKTTLNDRAGIAISLGHMGRYAVAGGTLRAGHRMLSAPTCRLRSRSRTAGESPARGTT